MSSIRTFSRFFPTVAIAISFGRATQASEGSRKVYFPVEKVSVYKMLKNSESWDVAEILEMTVALDMHNRRKFKIFTSGFSCGGGVCHQYLFEQFKNDRFRFVGMIPGKIEVSKAGVENGLRDLVSTNQVGGLAAESFSLLFRFDGQAYRISR